MFKFIFLKNCDNLLKMSDVSCRSWEVHGELVLLPFGSFVHPDWLSLGKFWRILRHETQFVTTRAFVKLQFNIPLCDLQLTKRI